MGSFRVKDLAIHSTVIGDVYADELVIHPAGQLLYTKVFAQNTVIHDGGKYEESKDSIVQPTVEELEPAVLRAKEAPAIQQDRELKTKSKGPTFISTY